MTQFLNALPSVKEQSTWLTIGNFDGVHKGHQTLIKALRVKAFENASQAVLITFYPHPRIFFNPGQESYYLMTREEKEQALSEQGLDKVITLPFDEALAFMPPEDFLRELASHFDLGGVVVGPDFSFGKGRRGDYSAIQHFMEAFGIPVIQTDPELMNGFVISSASIRSALWAGKPELASVLMGRPYSISGKVSEGKKLGKKLGLPTANLLISGEKLVPKYGVYASRLQLEGKTTYAAVSSLGVRPTFEDTRIPNLETLILDFDDNIYQKAIKVELLHFIRPEMRFEHIDDLIRQIEADKKEARRFLNNGSEA
ncbi:MAG: bifunctional riboflavin kinase/FAD synthetase [Anaerolineaceae bacterium]|nr:bifunctional riboflavin kinase/FAD synthetase [Anaerolineaceae bacterium]